MSLPLEAQPNELVQWFQIEFPDLVKTMHDSTHHFSESKLNPYHLEGDIFCHSMMVLLQATNLFPDNHYVRWSALLHDIGKPAARKVIEERERVAFHGHDGISAFMALDVLNKTNLSMKDKIHIFKIIALHGTLFNFLKADGSLKQEVIELFKNEKTLFRDVYQQTVADHSGRFWESEHKNVIPLSDVIHDSFNGVIDVLDDEPIIEQRSVPHLWLMCGPPCSGKTTEREIMKKNNPDMIIISRDDLVEKVAVKYGLSGYNEAFRFLMENSDVEKTEIDDVIGAQINLAKKQNKSVLVDMTLMSKKSRRKWINTFPNHQKTCFLFLKGFETLMKHSEQRERETGKGIPRSVFINMFSSFSLPLRGEGFDTILYNYYGDLSPHPKG